MILIFEQDTRIRDGCYFFWKPMIFRGTWNGRKTWRLGWGLWTVSYYPSPGLHDFFEYAKDNCRWFERSTR